MNEINSVTILTLFLLSHLWGPPVWEGGWWGWWKALQTSCTLWRCWGTRTGWGPPSEMDENVDCLTPWPCLPGGPCRRWRGTWGCWRSWAWGHRTCGWTQTHRQGCLHIRYYLLTCWFTPQIFSVNRSTCEWKKFLKVVQMEFDLAVYLKYNI